MMYSMKEACIQTGMSYETLKFYCKEGLVPNVKRDSHNYRVFDDRDIKWIQSLGCLKRCGMTLAEMKEYLAYCLEGPSSIPERKEILAVKKEALLASMEKLQKAIDYSRSEPHMTRSHVLPAALGGRLNIGGYACNLDLAQIRAISHAGYGRFPHHR